MSEIADCIKDYFELVQGNGYFKERRTSQARFWIYETIDAHLKNNFYQNDLVRVNLDNLEQVVSEEKVSPFVAAQELLEKYFNAMGKH